MEITVGSQLCGVSIKEYLFGRLMLSSNMVKKLKNDPCGILINGTHVTVRHILASGEILTLSLDDKADDMSENVVPRELPISVLYEDEYIVALNKPSGMPTHPSHNHYEDTLANATAFYYKSLDRPFVFRAINRLDSDTSGIVLIAKSKAAAYSLSQSMSRNEFKKSYIALLHGVIQDSGRIELPIKRSETSTMLRTVDTTVGSKAKYSLTEYSVIEKFEDCTLVSATPVTGRTHQLRVHFSYIGHPIFGDGLYGITSDGSDFSRLALHAYSLTFIHPALGKMTIAAPLCGIENDLFNNSLIPIFKSERT